MTIFFVTPSCWSEDLPGAFDPRETEFLDKMTEFIALTEPEGVVISGFDLDLAGLIANRLVAWGIEDVHVEGSGLNCWPTPQVICSDLMDRLRLPKAA